MELKRLVTRKRLILGVVAVVVAAGLTMVFRSDPVEVEAAEVRRGPMRVTITAEAKTRVRDRYVVAAPVTGRLERIALAEGAPVHAGALIARVAPTPMDEPAARQAQARLDAARAALAAAETHVGTARAASAQARRDLARSRVLAQAGALPARAVEEAALSARSRADDERAALARSVAAAAEVRQAIAAMSHAIGGAASGSVIAVRAPSDGRVLRVPDRSERVVAAGTPIAEIGDTRALEVVADVLSSDAARMQPGMRAELNGWGGERPVGGRVRLIEPSATTRVSALGVEEQRVNVIIDAVQPPPALGDGYRVDAEIIVWERPFVLTVPSSALVRSGSGWAAFVVDGGRARLRSVTVGAIGDAMVEVVGGVAQGERVVVFPSDRVKHGGRIAVRE